jgi:uncharacterized Tic20 family protein
LTVNDPDPIQASAAVAPPKTERDWAVICHLAAIAGLLLPWVGIIVGPVIVWLLKRDGLPFVDDQGREAVNFQITMFIAGIVCMVLMMVLIGFALFVALVLFDIAFTIVAAVKASEGVAYRYPVNLRLIK